MPSPIITPHTGMRRRHDTGVFEKHTLSNGMVVWQQRSPLLLTDEGVLFAALPGIGSVADPVGKEGLAHFFEHLPFKGTTSYTSAEAITTFVRDRGGSRNAATSPSWIRYHAAMPGHAYADAVGLVKELVFDPLLRPADVEGERGVIVGEYERRFVNGAELSHYHKMRALLGAHPLANPALGILPGIAAVTVDDMQTFRVTYYHAGNVQLVVGGAFAEQPGFLEELEKVFGHLPAAAPNLPFVPALVAARGTVTLTDKRYGRDMLSLYWIVPSGTREDAAALQLLFIAHSGGRDTPLIMELRGRLGLVYDTHLMGLRKTPYGWIISLNLPVPRARFAEVRKIFEDTFRNLSAEQITLTLARHQLDRQSEFKDPIETAGGAVNEVGLYGRTFSYADDAATMDAIDLDTVWRWRAYFLENEPFVCEVLAGDA